MKRNQAASGRLHAAEKRSFEAPDARAHARAHARAALELLDLLDLIHDLIPPGRAHLKDQLDRTSVVLNIAEGAGEFSPPEKQRFYRMARRSATETAAILDILERRRSLPNESLQPARDLVVRVVSMLVRLIS